MSVALDNLVASKNAHALVSALLRVPDGGKTVLVRHGSKVLRLRVTSKPAVESEETNRG